MVNGAILAELETRLAKGEGYLANNPADDNAQALYYRLLAEYVALKEADERAEDITAVIVDLPENTRWQRKGCDTVHSTVRVVWSGEPAAGEQMNRAELAELLGTRAAVIAAKEGV